MKHLQPAQNMIKKQYETFTAGTICNEANNIEHLQPAQYVIKQII
jgi:hypothetical protein